MSGKKENLIIPVPEEGTNLQRLRDSVTHYVNKVIDKGYSEDSDDEHFIFEEVVKAFYGKDIFNQLNTINRNKKK